MSSKRVASARIKDVRNKGKWIITSLDNGENILLSLGMGADILYFDSENNQADKYQVRSSLPMEAAIRPGSGGSENSCSLPMTNLKQNQTRKTSRWTRLMKDSPLIILCLS